jgi:LytS/YehU family sensor histidine kinase
VFLIKERESDRVRALELDRARTRAELDAFLAQVDPHFLFNSLNTLGYLIDTAPARAAAFTSHLAEMMRYVLARRGQTLVTLREELAFVDDFVALMKIRFGGALTVEIVDEGSDREARIPPTALQALVDNAIKHNELGEERPLRIVARLGPTAVTVENERRPRRTARASAGVGLHNLDERVRLTSGQRISIAEREGRFVVRVPLANDDAGLP